MYHFVIEAKLCGNSSKLFLPLYSYLLPMARDLIAMKEYPLLYNNIKIKAILVFVYKLYLNAEIYSVHISMHKLSLSVKRDITILPLNRISKQLIKYVLSCIKYNESEKSNKIYISKL